MGDAILELEGIHMRMGGRPVLTGVDLRVQPGEAVALLGVNGAGKSTLLRIASGLLQADRGTVRIDGKRLSRRTAARFGIGYCPQENVVYPELSVEENLLFVARLHGMSRAERFAAVPWAMRRLGLEEQARIRACQLSGGQQRRLTLAAAVIHRPRLLLIEEPEAGVDPQSRLALGSLLRELSKESAVLWTSHDVDLVHQAASRALMLDQGVIVAQGKPRDVASRFSAAIGSVAAPAVHPTIEVTA